MIKLFDFKFLILLTLAVVIYFMYKDMDEQRDRIQKLEDAYRAQLYNQISEEKEIPLQLPPPQLPTKQLPSKQLPPQQLPPQQLYSQQLPSQQILSQLLPPQKLPPQLPQELPKQQENKINNLKLELPNKMASKTELITPSKEKVELPVYLEKDEENNNNDLEESDLEESNLEESSESEEEDSSSTYISKKSKKSVLEVYSNDNDKLEETINPSEDLEETF
jgi:hypothetical protein